MTLTLSSSHNDISYTTPDGRGRDGSRKAIRFVIKLPLPLMNKIVVTVIPNGPLMTVDIDLPRGCHIEGPNPAP